jgi:hypothetical protein
MSAKARWLLAVLVPLVAADVGAAALGVPPFRREARSEAPPISPAWQQTRRRLATARAMFGGGLVERNMKSWSNTFVKGEGRAAYERRMKELRRTNQQMCDSLATAWAAWIVRCADAREAARDRIRAEMTGLAAGELQERITACENSPDNTDDGPEPEDRASCLRFFRSGNCEILDYDPNELALSTLDLMVKRPRKPQPQLFACPMLFGS